MPLCDHSDCTKTYCGSCLYVWLQINLDYQTKDAIIQSLRLPSLTCFLSAQKKVFNLMENNSYPRFIHSELYKELCAIARGEGKYLKF